ncbi:hypothetical protein ACPCUF_21285 [Streptomyces griseoincarnatus]
MSAPGRASQPLRIGVLRAARIAERALAAPARAGGRRRSPPRTAWNWSRRRTPS